MFNKFRQFQGYKYLNEQQEGGEGNAAPEANEQQEQPQGVALEEFEALRKENESMRNKMSELLGEKKREQEQRRQAQEEAAKKAGDFEQLYKSQQQKTEEYQNALQELKSSIAREKVQSESIKLASRLSEGHNAELLATFIEKRLKYTDEGTKVLDNSGQLTVSTLDDLANEFKTDARFSALIKGAQSTGGGASGNNGASGAGSKVITRSEFDKLDPSAKAKFMQSGGRLSD